METLATIISVPTLLFLVMPALPAATIVGAGICMLITFASLCYAFVRVYRSPARPWLLGGFFLGAFALVALFLLIDRRVTEAS